MKKVISVLTIMILIAAVVAGCSSASGGSKETASNTESANKDASQKVSISFWALDSGTSSSLVDSIVQSFKQENPNIDVVVSKYAVDPFKEALKVAANSKTLPDLWFTWGGSLGSFYPENGLTMDLTQVAKDHKWSEKYNKAAIEMSTFGGKISGVPYHLNVLGMWYPKTVYDKSKLSEPATFNEFEAQLKTMKDNGVTPLSFGGKGGWHTMRLTEQLLEHFAGPELHDKLNTLSASWNDPAVIKTFEKIKEYTDKGYFPKGYVSLSPTEAEALIYQAKTGLINEGTWFDGVIMSNKFNPVDFGAYKFPNDQKPSRASVFAEMLQINVKSDKAKQDAALKFAEYMTDVNVINKNIDDYGSPATLNVTFSDKTPHLKKLLDSANEGSFLITDQAMPQDVVQKLFEAQDKVALNEWTPQQAAEAMDKAANDYKSKKK